jgi:transposase InsO family protein
VLVELNVVEQRYRVVLEVLEDGVPVCEVAERHGVSRQTVHSWLRRYRESGMSGLVDRSRRPQRCPHRMSAEAETMVCELRRQHPHWGPRRLVHELRSRGLEAVPGRTSVYRVLDRNGLIEPVARRRQRAAYRRWERTRPMELWQMDVVGFRLGDGSMVSLLTGVDDHSRYCVCAAVMRRAESRSVCTALSEALRRHGVPDQLLTDNGRVFTGRFTRPHPAVVQFDRICQVQGIRHLLTKPYSPTTTGKIERFHRTLRVELLNEAKFATMDAAQRAIDAFVSHYNLERPHQALGMLTPAVRFRYDETERTVTPPITDAELRTLVVAPKPVSVATPPVLRSDEPEGIRRSISSIGVIRFAGAQYGLGRRFANHIASVVPDGDLIRFYVDGQFVRTHVRLPTGGYAHGDTKLEVIYRNRKSSVPDVVGSASVKDQVDLICQA